MARFMGMWRRPDEGGVEEGVETREAEGEDLSLAPGLDRFVEEGASRREEAAEHEEPR